MTDSKGDKVSLTAVAMCVGCGEEYSTAWVCGHCRLRMCLKCGRGHDCGPEKKEQVKE